MMNILTKDKWARFKSDGRLFEKLIHDLLCAMYPKADFTHTSWSHDGGKDFEYGFPFLDEEVKIWAECKYHKDSLPIHEVSMTLCMAYIESAFSILFFSYSPVNSEFQKYIDLYKKKSNKIIKIYADSSLETLLIRYRNDFDFESYFGEIKTVVPIENNKVSYKYWLHTSAVRKDSQMILYLNDIIVLEFSAMNLCSESVTFELQLHYPDSGNCFQILDKQFASQNLTCVLTVPPHGICGKTINLSVQKYQPVLKLPYLNIKCNGTSRKLSIDKKLECRWLAETLLIGKEYKKIQKKWQASLNGLHSSFGVIVGRSGTGKSRLIQEIELMALYEGYQTICFDADKTHSLTALYFFRKLISTIEDIPFSLNLSRKTSKYIYEYFEERAAENDFIFQILSNDTIDFHIIKDKLIAYLVVILNTKKYLLILDNIQYYDEMILDVLQSVIESQDLKSKARLLFAANLDFTFKDTTAEQFIKNFEWKAYHNPKQYFYDEVKGFTDKEAQEYLRKCLYYNPKSKDYDNFPYASSISQIVKNYGTNPFFLQNYMLYLLQKGIIDRTETSSFYIVDCSMFQTSLKKIPEKLLDLLSDREEALVNHIIKDDYLLAPDVLQKKYRLFVTYLAFARWLPIKVIHKLTGIPHGIIQEMMQAGFLKMNSDGFYGFYHQQIESYFHNRYHYAKLSEDELRSYIDITMKEYDRSLYLESIFLAQYELNQVQPRIFNKIIANVLVQQVDYCRSYEICKAVSVLLHNESFKVQRQIYTKLYQNITIMCLNRSGLHNTEKIYEDVYEYFCFAYSEFSDVLAEVMNILRAYIRAMINMHKPKESLQKNKYILDIMKLHFQKDKNYTILQIELYYLQIHAYNILSDLNKALEISDICIDKSKKAQNNKYIIQSCFVKGDIYYTYKLSYSYKDQIINNWNAAWEFYQNLKDSEQLFYSDLAFHLELLMRKTLAMLFNAKSGTCQEDGLYEIITELASYFDKTNMMYYEIKIRLLYIVISLCMTDDKIECDYNYLEMLLKRCIDICAVYGNETLYLDCFHLLAILQKNCGHQFFAQDNYKKCFAILQRILEQQISLEHWSYFLFDMVIAMRENNEERTMPPHIWDLIETDSGLSEKLHRLATIRKDAFQDYLDALTPVSLPYDPDTHTYFPKI